jgi:hypothetical protein
VVRAGRGRRRRLAGVDRRGDRGWPVRGAYTLAFYFTSERAAREGERKEPPARLKAQMAEMNQLNIGEPKFLDLPRPWLYSP